MTETPRPDDARRVLEPSERDELVALVNAFAQAEFADGRDFGKEGSTERGRAARDAYKAFLDRLYELTRHSTLEEIHARWVAKRADGPRPDAPVEVVAELENGADQ